MIFCTFAFTVTLCFAWYQIGFKKFASCKYFKEYNFQRINVSLFDCVKGLGSGFKRLVISVYPMCTHHSLYRKCTQKFLAFGSAQCHGVKSKNINSWAYMELAYTVIYDHLIIKVSDFGRNRMAKCRVI